jgi:hypothetical protein
MKGWIKAGFIISVVLNVLLAAGLVFGRSYVRRTNFELVAMTAKAESHLVKSILSTLEAGNPDDIKQLKERLRMMAEQGEKTAEIWESAVEK